ncbi:MAG: hypothetical protein Q9210_004121 [Variospora velana]
MSSMSSTSRHAAPQTTATQTYQEPKPRSQDSLTELPSQWSPDIKCDRCGVQMNDQSKKTTGLPGAQAKSGGAENQDTWKGEGGGGSRNSHRKFRFFLAGQERSKEEGDSENKKLRAHRRDGRRGSLDRGRGNDCRPGDELRCSCRRSSIRRH